MKKLLALTAAALIVTTAGAMAEDGKPHHPDPAKMFEKVDADGNGSISKAEFLAKHEEMFTKLDANGDGSLTQEEIEAGREKWKAKQAGKDGAVSPAAPTGEAAPKE